MAGRVDRKVAIVTGGARGMGAAFARRLADEGAMVMLTDVLEEEGQATAHALGSKTEAAFGPVSVLVNNAAIISYGEIETMEESSLRRILDVNLVSVFLGMKSVVSSMKRAGGGSIINMSSMGGLVGFPNTLGYVASKFAVCGMSKSAAIELAPYKIRVNSVHPGFIRTPMMVMTAESKKLLSSVAAQTPAARLGEPDEVASIVLMLASDESRFSTGAEFAVDGGYCCH